jgi:hypothetical protein
MAIAIAIKSRTFDYGTETVRGTMTFSGNYVAGGDTANLSGATSLLGERALFSGGVPLAVWITGINGYNFSYVNGTTPANGKVKVATASNTEHAAAGYVAGVSGDTVSFEAIFAKSL